MISLLLNKGRRVDSMADFQVFIQIDKICIVRNHLVLYSSDKQITFLPGGYHCCYLVYWCK